MKVCFKCGAEKPLTEYYKHNKMADGHLNKCKCCTKSDVRKHRAENDSVREYDRQRGSRQPENHTKEYRAKYPNKYKAHTAVGNAIRDGRLIRPTICEDCKTTCKPDAHHDDYLQRLSVRWLCSRCHHIWHAANGEALNA